MELVHIAALREGDCFDRALFAPNGRKVIGARVKLTAAHLQTILRQSSSILVLASTAKEVTSANTQDLDPRFTQGHASADPPASKRITPPSADSARLRKQRMKDADVAATRMQILADQIDLKLHPSEMEIWDKHRTSGSEWPELKTLTEFRQSLVDRSRHLYLELEAGQTIEVGKFTRIVDELWKLLIDHRERFTQLALMVPRRNDYLPDHAMCVAVLSMAIAGQLTLDERAVRDACLAGLLYDLGMTLVPPRIRNGGQQLTDIDRGRVQRHTDYSVVLLDQIENLPDIIKLAAYQHHERENGTGYPRALRGEKIHDLARILTVADVFAALTGTRNYRKNKLPYAAMEQMVHSAAANQFDRPTVRALVQAAGLFPVGSCVMLSNHCMARVIGANPNHLDRPTVQPISDAAGPVGPALNLSRLPVEKITVIRAIAAPQDCDPIEA